MRVVRTSFKETGSPLPPWRAIHLFALGRRVAHIGVGPLSERRAEIFGSILGLTFKFTAAVRCGGA